MDFKLLILIIPALLAGYLYYQIRLQQQRKYIGHFRFNSLIAKKIKTQYPHLSDEDVARVFSALRDYFTLCHMAKQKMVAMPSQVVDLAWHEFILITRSYQSFCQRAFGRFLHHNPSEVMSSPVRAQESIKRAWRLACAQKNIDPARPSQLPLLFSIDATLKIEDGFHYSLDCKRKANTKVDSNKTYIDYCAAHIACASGCSGTSGNTSTESSGLFSGSTDSGCSGGCGGD
ncbi:glycine-rich domain-containing protein [Pseudoteredinibacter isoporae]|uniref:glycine-rich domain-containing protein n=1 Tax=Pseudoteredinibacter isoporae TaxID=570281 RepID=UPI003105B6BD